RHEDRRLRRHQGGRRARVLQDRRGQTHARRGCPGREGVAVYIAILQFHLMIDGATGLKDKRRVVRSVKDRLHKQHMVAVAEVDDLETWNLATMGLVACNRSHDYLQEQMQAIIKKLESL